MTKGKRLRREAKAAATQRGHIMSRFIQISRNDKRPIWESRCKRCGDYVAVYLQPLPNEIHIGGTAVAGDCPPDVPDGSKWTDNLGKRS